MQATVDVPADALVADLVFLDSENISSGFYDNNGGLDYHVPVAGAPGRLPPLRIAHVSVEVAPVAKVGGMADVVTALGRAVREYGHDVEARHHSYPIACVHLLNFCCVATSLCVVPSDAFAAHVAR
jgi:starch synthase